MRDHGTWSVHVIDEDGCGILGARVSHQCGTAHGVTTTCTDADGWAHFTIIDRDAGGALHAVHRIWVDEREVWHEFFHPCDGETFSFIRPAPVNPLPAVDRHRSHS